jgi:hypothetical protein
VGTMHGIRYGCSGARAFSEEVRHASRNADSACPFRIDAMAKRVTLGQHFMTHVIYLLWGILVCTRSKNAGVLKWALKTTHVL